MKKFSEFITEKNDDKVIFVEGELWITYSQGSGQTAQIRDLKKYLTDNSKDEHFDSLVYKLSKWSKENKPKKSKSNVKLFEIPKYPTVKYEKYDIWGGTVKPIGKLYMIITEEKNTIVNLFDNKNEAMNWINTIA